jgi:ABC-type transporter Mla subunit MlaD
MENSSLTIAVWVLAAVSLLWTIMFALAATELRRLSWRLQEFIRVVEMELKPAVEETREAVRNINQAAQGVTETTGRLQESLAAFHRAGENVRLTTETIRGVFGRRLIPLASVLAGLRAGGKILWKLYTRRRETP